MTHYSEEFRASVPGNKLSEQERTEILVTANLPAFANLPPSQIVPALADEGCYIASESSFYRILRENKQLAHRGKAKGPSHSRPQLLEATAPNQLSSWDIIYLATTVKGFLFLSIPDSRCIQPQDCRLGNLCRRISRSYC